MKLSVTTRTLSAFAALSVSTLLVMAGGTPAFAGQPGFQLTTVDKTASGKRIFGETMWNCTEEGCTANKATSRALVLCADAAREVGKIASFNSLGKEMDANTLAKCNAKARSGVARLGVQKDSAVAQK